MCVVLSPESSVSGSVLVGSVKRLLGRCNCKQEASLLSEACLLISPSLPFRVSALLLQKLCTVCLFGSTCKFTITAVATPAAWWHCPLCTSHFARPTISIHRHARWRTSAMPAPCQAAWDTLQRLRYQWAEGNVGHGYSQHYQLWHHPIPGAMFYGHSFTPPSFILESRACLKPAPSPWWPITHQVDTNRSFQLTLGVSMGCWTFAFLPEPLLSVCRDGSCYYLFGRHPTKPLTLLLLLKTSPEAGPSYIMQRMSTIALLSLEEMRGNIALVLTKHIQPGTYYMFNTYWNYHSHLQPCHTLESSQ